MSVITPRTQVQGLPANGVTTGAVQVTGTALRISARITTGNSPQTLALARMNSGTGNWYRATDVYGESRMWTLPGVGDANQGNADLDITLPAEGASEYYHLLVESPSAFPGVAEIESLSAPAASGGAAPQGRAITGGGGITGGGDLSADRTLSLGGTADQTLSTGALTWAGASSKAGSLLAGAGATLSVGSNGAASLVFGATGIATFQGKQAATATANVIADPGNAGAISVATSGVCNLTSAGAETRTLAIPTFVGQRLTICMDTDGGDCVLTVASPINQTGNNTVTFNDAGDCIELVARTVGGTRKWQLVVNDGATLSTV